MSIQEVNPWDLGDGPQESEPLSLVHHPEKESATSVRVTAPAPVISVAGLTPVAKRVLESLLDLGSERPVSPPELPAELLEIISQGSRPGLDSWAERNLWVSKSSLLTFDRCQGAFKASKEKKWAGLVTPVAVGQVAHRAIQISYTHPNASIEDYVRSAISAQEATDDQFHEFWGSATMAVQSDVISQAVSKTTAFLDSWPPLNPEWSPRFEESTTARVGKVTMSVRPDLILGRPRPDLRQTMLLVDFKTGELKDEHEREAAVYALVSTLRHGVAPFKSVVFSLASGDWVSPEITPDLLRETAQWVGEAASAMADVLSEKKEPTLTVSGACSWCPLQQTCVAYAEASEEDKRS
jgi:hypothetical protein